MCVIERTKLEDVANAMWFNAFSLSKWTFAYSPRFLHLVEFTCAAFETVSAYGTVGLSFGIPTVRPRAFPVFRFF